MNIPSNYFSLSLGLVLFAVFFTSCSEDDSSETTEINNALLTALTDNDTKTWRIESATLQNESVVDLDVSHLYNVKDDEWVFSLNETNDLSLQWHREYTMNYNASSVVEFKSDKRVSPLFIDQLTIMDGMVMSNEEWSFRYVEDPNHIEATIPITDNATLELSLTPKQLGDYLRSPEALSERSKLLTLENTAGFGALKLSKASNALYAVYNTYHPSNEYTLVKYDLTTQTETSLPFERQNLAVGMHIEFVNDQIWALGGSEIHQFNYEANTVLGTLQLPVEGARDGQNTNYGSAVVDDQLYLLGGLFNSIGGFSHLVQCDTASAILQPLADYEEYCMSPDGEYVYGKIVSVGGHSNFLSQAGDVLSYDPFTGEKSTKGIRPILAHVTSSVVENLIYVAGTEWVDENGDGEVEFHGPFVGVYDTHTEVFTFLEVTFPEGVDRSDLRYIQATENELYLAYGEFDKRTFSVYSYSID